MERIPFGLRRLSTLIPGGRKYAIWHKPPSSLLDGLSKFPLQHDSSPMDQSSMGNKAKEQSSLLEGMKHPFAEQWKACSTISLPFDQFQLCDMSLDHAVIDPPG